MNTFLRIAAAIGVIDFTRTGIDATLLLSQTSMYHAVSTAWAFLVLVGYLGYLVGRGFET